MSVSLIGLHGTRGAGKDTLFRLWQQLHPKMRRWAFADELKRDLQPLIRDQFGFDILNCTQAEKELVRSILISYGMTWRAIDPLHWVKVVTNSILAELRDNPDLVCVVTDVRFINEAEYL